MTLASSGFLTLGGPSNGNSGAETSVNIELNGIDGAVTPTSSDSMISADNDNLLGNSNRPRVFPPDWYGASALPPVIVAYFANVAGGGGGAGGSSYTIEGKSGGGAGGVLGYLVESSAYILSVSGRYQVVVGAGGGGGGVNGYPSGAGNQGNPSYWVFEGTNVSPTTGGGFGADGNTQGGTGGSGGGVTNAGSHWDSQPGGAGITGQGYAGGNGGHKGPGGGGGGNGGPGQVNVGGNAGRLFLPVPPPGLGWYYDVAGGGGGGGWEGAPQYGGGPGGSYQGSGNIIGGYGAWDGNINYTQNGTNGTAATGSGGGGAGSNQAPAGTGGNGGSGVVIFTYQSKKQLFTSTGNTLQQTATGFGDYWWTHIFSSSGYLQGMKYIVAQPVLISSSNFGQNTDLGVYLQNNLGWDGVTPIEVGTTSNLLSSVINQAAITIARYASYIGRITLTVNQGNIVGGAEFPAGIYVGTLGPVTINNYGTIEAYVVSGTIFGRSIAGGSPNFILNNYGTILGDIVLSQSTVNNYGTINGNLTNIGGTTNNQGTVTGTIS